MDKNGSEQFSVDNLLSLISLVIPEVPHYSILAISIPHIEWLFRTLAAQQDYPLFLRMMNHFFKDNYDKVGWTQSGNWDKDIYRYLMLPYAVRFNVGKAQKDGYKLWKELLIDCKDTKTGVGACAKIPPDVRLAVYMSAVLFGDDDDRQKLRELAQQQAENEVYFPMEYRAMFQALALSNRTKDIDELIPLIIKTTEKPEVFKQVGSSLLMYFAQNPVAGDLLGAYLKKNPQTIRDPKYFSVYVSAMTQNWWSKADIEKFTALRDSLRLNDEHQRIMEDELKKLKSRLPLREKYYPQIVRFLYNQYVTIGEVPWSVQIETDKMKLEPLEYNTIIHPYFPSHIKYPWHKNMTFEGESNMRFKIQRAQGEVNQITVNAHRMIITADDIVIYDKNGNNHKVIGLEKVYDDGKWHSKLTIFHIPLSFLGTEAS
ncbi:hypothetical protein AB6A40_009635 [Gnathostoma spinigerum]|uniref:ERAP1-like C-terminal domain-containing protein n=1 Tax=Gnathostoma spinigerum TaxID=75299 RepID=A0ABD6ESV1_9BILA